MNQSEKAKELYVNCDNTDPNESTLMPFHYERFMDTDILFNMVAAFLINRYALQNYNQDWIPYAEGIRVHKNSQMWNELKLIVNNMEELEFLETKVEKNQTFIRWCDDGIYEPENYQTKASS